MLIQDVLDAAAVRITLMATLSTCWFHCFYGLPFQPNRNIRIETTGVTGVLNFRHFLTDMNSKVERQTELAEGSSSFLEVVRPTAYQLSDLLAKLLLVLVWIVFEHIIFSDFLSISYHIRSCHIISYVCFQKCSNCLP